MESWVEDKHHLQPVCISHCMEADNIDTLGVEPSNSIEFLDEFALFSVLNN